MENASNALIIAGGILIGVLILSLAVYLFIDFGSTSADINKKTAEQQLIQFNSKFTVYESTEKKWTIYDIGTVAGYAHENNEFYGKSEGFDNNFYLNNHKITVNIVGSGIKGGTVNIQEDSVNRYNDMIQDEIKNNIELPKYNCVITYYDNGRVKSVTFNQ